VIDAAATSGPGPGVKGRPKGGAKPSPLTPKGPEDAVLPAREHVLQLCSWTDHDGLETIRSYGPACMRRDITRPNSIARWRFHADDQNETERADAHRSVCDVGAVHSLCCNGLVTSSPPAVGGRSVAHHLTSKRQPSIETLQRWSSTWTTAGQLGPQRGEETLCACLASGETGPGGTSSALRRSGACG
jgi:hypothetical protein